MSVHRGGRLDDEGLERLLAAMEAHLFVAEIDPVEGYRDVYTGPGEDRLLGGLPPEGEEPGEAWSARVDPRDEPRYRVAMARAQSGEPAEVEYRLLGYDGVTRWVQERCRPWRDRDGRLMLDGLVVDVTPWRLEQERLQQQLREALEAMTDAHREAEVRSRTDGLTGVFNRRHFHEVLNAELARAERDESTPGVLMVDIDHFKRVNDSFGHQAGDEVLIEVANRIGIVLRSYDSIARYGGEEFVVLVPAVPDERVLGRIGEQLRRAVAQRPIVAAGHEIAATVSVGAARPDERRQGADELIDAADQALYVAKRRGRNRVCLAADVTRDDLAAQQPEVVQLAQAMALAVSVRPSARADTEEPHAEQVAELAARIATHLGLPSSSVLLCRIGGWLHDLGKGAIPDELLAKRGPLEPDELALMRTHPIVGEQLVRQIGGLADAAPILRHHHERYDGFGYPDGLRGEAIPIEARIVGAAEAYSSMTTGHAYRRSREQPDALAELVREAGGQFDPAVIGALQAVLATERERLRSQLAIEGADADGGAPPLAG
jgi:diguanylate cyclase (GGDEF)-like protein